MLKRAFDDFAHIDRGVIDRAPPLHFVGNQMVLLVEEQNAELLDVVVTLGQPQVIENLVPGRKRRL